MYRTRPERLGLLRHLALASLASLASFSACADQSTSGASTPVVIPLDASAPSTPDSSAPSRASLIRVATFNLHRYFDTTCDSGMCAAGDYEDVPSQAMFDAVTTRLAMGIAKIDPDVISVEEMETTHCLDALVAKLASLGKSYPIAHLGETGGAGSVDVAILARGTLTEIKTHRDTPIVEADGTTTTFARELLEVRMTFGKRAVIMFGAHFRSQVSDDPARRLAEAKAAQMIVAKTATDLPDALVMLGGDLNDKPGSATIDALEAGGALFRVASDVPVDAQGTYIFQGTKSALDHLFVGAPQKARYVPMSATVYRDDPKAGYAGSDHAALAADFSIE